MVVEKSLLLATAIDRTNQPTNQRRTRRRPNQAGAANKHTNKPRLAFNNHSQTSAIRTDRQTGVEYMYDRLDQERINNAQSNERMFTCMSICSLSVCVRDHPPIILSASQPCVVMIDDSACARHLFIYVPIIMS